MWFNFKNLQIFYKNGLFIKLLRKGYSFLILIMLNKKITIELKNHFVYLWIKWWFYKHSQLWRNIQLTILTVHIVWIVQKITLALCQRALWWYNVYVEYWEFLWHWRKHENRGRIMGHILKRLYSSWELRCSRTLDTIICVTRVLLTKTTR